MICRIAGAVLLTVATGPSPQRLFLFVIIVQAFFGVAVGGEFPVAAASAAERAESDEQLRAKRGRTVVLVFSMQVRAGCLCLCLSLSAAAWQAGKTCGRPVHPDMASREW